MACKETQWHHVLRSSGADKGHFHAGFIPSFPPAHVTRCMWLYTGRLGMCTWRAQTQTSARAGMTTHYRTPITTAAETHEAAQHINAKAQCNLYICRPVWCPRRRVHFCLFQKFDISEASAVEKKKKATRKSWTETERTSRWIRLITTYIKYTLFSVRELSPHFFFFCSLLPPSGRCRKLQ